MTTATTAPQVQFSIAWLGTYSADYQEFGWTILAPGYLVPVIKVGALTRTPTAAQAREIADDLSASATSDREVEHLEWFIERATADHGRDLSIDFWLPAELLPWSPDSWGVGDLS